MYAWLGVLSELRMVPRKHLPDLWDSSGSLAWLTFRWLGQTSGPSSLLDAPGPASWNLNSWVWEPKATKGPRVLTHSTGLWGLFAEVTWVAEVGDGAVKVPGMRASTVSCGGNYQGGVKVIWAHSQVLASRWVSPS